MTKKRKSKPPLDVRIVKAQARKEKALVAFDRWYVRLQRAARALDKARRVIASADRLIDRVSSELAAADGASS